MTNFNKACVTMGDESVNNQMNWTIYNEIISSFKGNNFRTVRFRLAFFLLAVTKSRISEILF